MTRAVFAIDNREDAPAHAIELKLSKREINKLTLLDALARAYDFPDYFAYNWDSAWDCLDDYASGDLLLPIFPRDRINQEDLSAFCDLIREAHEEWARPRLWIWQAK